MKLFDVLRKQAIDYARRHLITISVLLSAIVMTFVSRFVIPADRLRHELPNSIAALKQIREKLNEHVVEPNRVEFLIRYGRLPRWGKVLGYRLWKRTRDSAVIRYRTKVVIMVSMFFSDGIGSSHTPLLITAIEKRAHKDGSVFLRPFPIVDARA